MLGNSIRCVVRAGKPRKARPIARVLLTGLGATDGGLRSDPAVEERPMRLIQRRVRPKSQGYLMRITSLAVVLSCSCALLLATAVGEDAGVGPPLALAAGQAPPLPKQGPLAEPRLSDQGGLTKVLTEYAISPATLTPDRVALGQKLFFEARLSGDGTVACAPCHNPDRAFTDGRPVSVGIHCRVGQRHAPTVLDALYNKTQFWDGRVNTLEQQAALPITNPFEMGSVSIGDAVSRIAGDKDYQTQFMQAFGRDVNEQDMLSAIAAYERTLASFDSPFDHFIAGDANAVSDSAKRGWELFNGKARCQLCHALTDNQPDTTLFMDNDFHNIGIGILRHHVAPLAQQAERELAQGRLGYRHRIDHLLNGATRRAPI